MRVFVILVMLFLNASGVYSQDNIQPVPANKKAERLAKRITSNLNSDKEKVIIIHKWITNHIKYDLKKYSAYDFSRDDISKILKRKKAICVGYADLFNELCRLSGIESVGISGYIKNPYVDVNDKFYLDEHMWNAVKIDDTWKLVDATWDAGYVSYFKMTTRGYLKYALTFGKSAIYKYKPHFVTDPSNVYLLKTGKFFSTDHLSTIPMWQLQHPPMTISGFENDSSYYFGNYDDTTDTDSPSTYDYDRTFYSRSDLKEQQKQEAFSGYAFNNRNNFSIGNWYAESAANLFSDLKKKELDSLETLLKIDSIIHQLDSADFHLKKNDSLLKVQEMELINNNNIKKDIFSKNNRKLLSSTSKIMGVTKDYKSFSKKCKSTAGRNINTNLKRLKILRKEREQLSSGKTTTNIDDEPSNLNQNALSLQDVMQNKLDTLQMNYSAFKDLVIAYSKTLSLYTKKQNDVAFYQVSNISQRAEFFDDFDFPLNGFRDTLISIKLSGDSTMFINDTSLFKRLYDKNKEIKTLFDSYFATGKKYLAEIKKTLKKSSNNSSLTGIYDETFIQINNSITENNQLESWWMSASKNLSGFGKVIYKNANKEHKRFIEEKKTENNVSKGRSDYFHKHASAYLKLNNKVKSNAARLRIKTVELSSNNN
jgi:hypothetical protein